jgi:hypothetical protein
MKKTIAALSGIFIVSALAWLPACDVNDPDRFIRPPIIKSFSPGSSTLSAAVGDTVRFSMAALDPDDQNLDYSFSLGDSLASSSNRWTYVVHEQGDVNITGRVTNGVTESTVRWQMTRIWPINRPPEIVFIEPQDQEITIVVGASIDFSISAVDPENRPLEYVYTIDESIVGVSRHFTYHSTFVGMIDVRALVTDGETFASHTWALRIASEPDSVPPARIEVTQIVPGVETGEIYVEWTAVGDDSMQGLPSHYIVRTSGMPITSENAWDSASDRPGEPAPGPPGSTHVMAIRDLPPAQLVYVAVRAMDDFGNLSVISVEKSTRSRGNKITGTVRDAVTDQPIPDVSVRILSAVDQTDAEGFFELSELPSGFGQLFFWDEENHAEFGNYFDVIYSPYEIIDRDHVNMWLLPNIELDSDDYPNFLNFFVEMTQTDGGGLNVLGTWSPPCEVFIPPLTANDIDYKQTAERIFQEWEDLIEVDIFEFVDDVPDVGIYIEYTDNDVGREHFLVTETDENGVPTQGKITLRTIYTDTTFAVLEVIVRHEVGHAIGMNHSSDPYHIMVGGRWPIADTQSPDETKLGKAMYRVPRYSYLEWFRYD